MLNIEDVMNLLGVGRSLATRYMQKYLGKSRKKGQKYLVPEESFKSWVRNGMR